MSTVEHVMMGEEVEISPATFSELADLEKEFASVELDALRRKEHALIPLYTRRSGIIQKIPGFWPQVLFNGPQEFQSILSLDSATEADNIDVQTISKIKNVTVERHAIRSATDGEPRSFRITFEFEKNDLFEDTKVVKEFNFVKDEDEDDGILMSKPVGFKWTKKGKKLMQSKTGGLLDLAVDLYKAEEAAKINIKTKDGNKAGENIDIVEREGLWQYEKLRQKLEDVEADDAEFEGCWLDWFGYRGPVAQTKEKDESNSKSNGTKKSGHKSNGAAQDDEEDDDFEDFDDEDSAGPQILDVEIFPAGEEVALSLAEELWPHVMDVFMQSQAPDDDDDDTHLAFEESEDDDDEEAPQLVEITEEMLDARPVKKQKTK